LIVNYFFSRYLAIDETDRMVEKGHFEELEHLMEMINADEEKRKLRQTFVFSATMTLVHELPKHLKHKKKTKNLTTEEKLEQVNSREKDDFLLLLDDKEFLTDACCPRRDFYTPPRKCNRLLYCILKKALKK